MEWPWGWHSIDEEALQEAAATRAEWEGELRRELPPKHVLYGLHAELIARRYDCDDALYVLKDGRVAQVHLTWRLAQEIGPLFPETVVYPSLERWVTEQHSKEAQRSRRDGEAGADRECLGSPHENPAAPSRPEGVS